MMNRAEIIGLNELSLPMQIKDKKKSGFIPNMWGSGRRGTLPVMLRLKAESSAHHLHLLALLKFYFIQNVLEDFTSRNESAVL